MPPRARWAVLAMLFVVFGVTVVVAGHRAEPVHSGVQRLGPEAGEPVAQYLRRADASLPSANLSAGVGAGAAGRLPHPGARG